MEITYFDSVTAFQEWQDQQPVSDGNTLIDYFIAEIAWHGPSIDYHKVIVFQNVKGGSSAPRAYISQNGTFDGHDSLLSYCKHYRSSGRRYVETTPCDVRYFGLSKTAYWTPVDNEKSLHYLPFVSFCTYGTREIKEA